MSIEVEVFTSQGDQFQSSIGTYSVHEESTPIVASDSSGGTGQITFTAVDNPSRYFNGMQMLNGIVTLTDGDRGVAAGFIDSVTANDGILSVSAASLLDRLVGERKVDWVDGTLEEVVTYYLRLCGYQYGIAVDSSIANINVTAPGFIGDVWVKMKELLAVHGAEISMIYATAVVRPIRSRPGLEINNIAESWLVSKSDVAGTVEVAYYNSELRESALIYPPFGWNEDVDVLTVDAGETRTVNIPLDAWVTEVSQPQVVDYVAQDSNSSVYAVAGNDGKPITAAQWTATGGDLVVAIGEDGVSLDVTLVGADGPSAELAPYRIAMTAGTGDYYSSLRIRGTGMVYERKTITVPTGASLGGLWDPHEPTSTPAAVIDNIYIRTESQARDVAADVAGVYASPERTINVSKADINKPNSSEYAYNYVTFEQSDEYLTTLLGTPTFGAFDSIYELVFGGPYFDNYDSYWYSQVESDFDYQVFGNACGARVQFRRNMYRIRSITVTENSVDYTAEADTTFEDFGKTTEGMTFAQFDSAFPGATFGVFAISPLLNVDPKYDE